MIPSLLLLNFFKKIDHCNKLHNTLFEHFNIHFKVVLNMQKCPINLFLLEGFQILLQTCNFARVESFSFFKGLYSLTTKWKAF